VAGTNRPVVAAVPKVPPHKLKKKIRILKKQVAKWWIGFHRLRL
jgi:hypothetical protein